MQSIDLFGDYENARMVTTDEYRAAHPGTTCPYDRLGESDLTGIPIAVTRNAAGKLDVTFIPETHLLAIGATRSGKTTGFVIPAMNVMLSRKNKPSMVISDPKGELFGAYAARFEAAGYRVILLNFNDCTHSDCWNPLTKYYRLYQKYLHAERDIRVVETDHGLRNEYEGVIYEDQRELDTALTESRSVLLDEVEKGILGVAQTIIETQNTRDPFWEDSARDLLRAILYAMLEDSETGEITEDNFSFETVLHIFDSFSSAADPYDKGYFSERDIRTSKAYQLAAKCVVEQANNTRHGIVSTFASRVSKFRDTAVRRITCTNTFELSELDGEVPTVIFLSFKDEESQHYEIISMFLCNLYTELIAIARRRGTALSRPFYFLLDEFGNLPKFKDFDKVISACGGRNIWFLLILQSYAQLSQVYGPEVSEIIKDNLNTHLFFGTNNPDTKRAFSEECGQKTVISPLSALNGSGESIMRYEKDTVPLVPISALDRIRPCECIVTRMREDVLNAHIERSYLCPEFDATPLDYDRYDRHIRFYDRRYLYYPGEGREDRSAGRGNIWFDLFG